MSRQFPVLRGLATLFVLINHSIALCYWAAKQYSNPLPGPISNTILTAVREIGIFGVPIFMFLSGAFLAFAIQDRPLRDSYRLVRANLIRVLSPYLIWSLVFYLVNFVCFGVKLTPLELIKNLLVGNPNYFIPLLVSFYLVSPFLRKLAQQHPIVLIVLVFIYQIFLANDLNSAYLGFKYPTWTRFLTLAVIRSQFGLWGIFFPMGMVYYYHMRKINTSLQKYTLWIAIFTAGLFILDIISMLNLKPRIPITGLFCPMIAVLLIPSIRREKIWGYRWFEKLGRNSYGYYLINLVVLSTAIFILNKAFPWLLNEYLLLAPFLLLLVIFIPMGLMKLFEHSRLRIVSGYIFG